MLMLYDLFISQLILDSGVIKWRDNVLWLNGQFNTEDLCQWYCS